MSSISEIYADNETIIRQIIAKYRPNKDDVDELAQETFLKCFAASLRQKIRDPKALLFRVAKNVAISEARRKRHSTTVSFEDSEGSGVLIDETQIPADEALHSRRKLSVFVLALECLPEEQRRALLMRKIDGLRFKQIATRLGVSVSTVEKRVASALLHCNAYLRDKGYDPSEFSIVSRAKPLQAARRIMDQTEA
ncbi:MAG: RNA polymerase sigma factor [Henriciella sp.]